MARLKAIESRFGFRYGEIYSQMREDRYGRLPR